MLLDRCPGQVWCLGLELAATGILVSKDLTEQSLAALLKTLPKEGLFRGHSNLASRSLSITPGNDLAIHASLARLSGIVR